MEAEEGNRSSPSGKTSWLLSLICPCLSSSETKPLRWFQVENGQLRSVPKKTLTKRSKSTKADRSKRAESKTFAKNAQNTPAAIFRHQDSSKFDWSQRWGPTWSISEAETNRSSISDFLTHLVFTARELSTQSSEASSSDDDETPPLLRSEGDPYQPYVIMEIANYANASGPEAESERLVRPVEAQESQDSEDDWDEETVND